MGSKPKTYHVKLGTMPAEIVIRGRPKLEKGASIWFRHAKGNTGVWTHGIIDDINPDGFMFISNM